MGYEDIFSLQGTPRQPYINFYKDWRPGVSLAFQARVLVLFHIASGVSRTALRMEQRRLRYSSVMGTPAFMFYNAIVMALEDEGLYRG
ncbi:hypothetical protein B0H65DRAFT_584929 [Neurospora tetraspora]|uniref:Uncharacterized protein n=1 Tax=Neurospora tetraspora TaxID=94610 RepID=A0AAE0MXL5_9PEZI|nr:hypothetical protein B0H65DRAFT_584929 [Neurospora tetraspora]